MSLENLMERTHLRNKSRIDKKKLKKGHVGGRQWKCMKGIFKYIRTISKRLLINQIKEMSRKTLETRQKKLRVPLPSPTAKNVRCPDKIYVVVKSSYFSNKWCLYCWYSVYLREMLARFIIITRGCQVDKWSVTIKNCCHKKILFMVMMMWW